MSDFRKEVAETFRGIRGDFERSLEPPPPDGGGPGGSRHKLDKSVVEQVRSDLDRIVERHDPGSSSGGPPSSEE